MGGRPGDAARAGGRRIALTAVTQIVFRGMNVGLGVATYAILARSLGPSDFGVWATALAFVSLFQFLTDFGVEQVGIQRMSQEPEREAEWLGAVLGVRSLGAVGASLICLAALQLLSEEGNVRVVGMVLAITILGTAPGSLLAVFESRLRAGVTMTLLTLQSLSWFGGVVLVAVLGGDVLDYAWAFVVAAIITSLGHLVATRRFARVALRRGRELWRPMVRVALPLGIAGVMSTIYYRIDAVLVFELASAREAGFYGAAYRFLDPLHLFPMGVMGAIFPVLAAVHGRDPERVRRLVQAGADYLAVVSLPILAGSLALSGPLVRLVFGPGFERAAGLVPILMLAFIFVSFGYLSGYLVPVLGLQWRFAAYATGGAVANVVLNVLLIPRYGAYGAAWTTVATEAFVLTLCLVTVLRALGVVPVPGRILRTAVAAGLMAASTALAVRAGLAAGIAAAVVTYPLMLVVLRVVVPGEVRGFLADRSAA